MADKINRMQLKGRLRRAGILDQADVYREEVRKRLIAENEKRGGHNVEANFLSWEKMWEVFGPAVERFEEEQAAAKKQAKQQAEDEARQKEEEKQTQKEKQESPPQLAGLPDTTTDEILDPAYTEADRGKQLRDALLWVAFEFDRVIKDTTDDGPVATLTAASSPPPNAFAVGMLRTYALSGLDKRRELFGRALNFATKTHDEARPEDDDSGSFLHELE